MSEYNIAILLSTHKRTDALSNSVFSLINNASDISRVQFILGVDNNDDIGKGHIKNVIIPELKKNKIDYTTVEFEPLGYYGLNRYYNTLAKQADADWLFVWCDDAVMQTQGWDDRIAENTGNFNLLKVHTHNEHPYSIFPIAPREWFDLFGYLSKHQLIDTELSTMAYMLNIMKIIEVDVLHDRHDLTGNNADENAQKKHYLEGNPSNPYDFYHNSFIQQRLKNIQKLSEYMKDRGLDITWWENVKVGKQDPWVVLRQNDPNKQTGQRNV